MKNYYEEIFLIILAVVYIGIKLWQGDIEDVDIVASNVASMVALIIGIVRARRKRVHERNDKISDNADGPSTTDDSAVSEK